MATTKINRLLTLGMIGARAAGPVKLNPDDVFTTTDTEELLARVIAEATEIERESQRKQRGKTMTLLRDDLDAVDSVPWDELLQSPNVVGGCAKKAGISAVEVLDFVLQKCFPTSWNAIFWMRAWYQQIDRNAAADVAAVTADLEKIFEAKTKEIASLRAKAAADARHGQAGGSRDKQSKIRAAWASGKYSSRDLCAEKEAGKFGMSFSTARRALRNTPDPS